MLDFSTAFENAFSMIVSMDADLLEIVARSLNISIVAVVIAALIGLPLGAALALFEFPGRRVLIVIVNAFMGLPPVVVGLAVYMMLSRAGPLGVLGLLFTPTAMIIAQCILILPIITALSRQIIADLWLEYRDQLTSFGIAKSRVIPTLIWDGRFSLLTTLLAGFGRASAEVGAVMIVGGNIEHATRVMTTAIALETSRGSLDLALGLGIVLMCITFAVNAAVQTVSATSERFEG